MDDNRYMRSRGAALYLGISESRLAQLRVYGGGPVFSKVGRTVIYDRTVLDAFLLENRRKSTSDTGRKLRGVRSNA